MVKRFQEARDNQFLFQNVQNIEIFKIFEMFQNKLTLTIQKANAFSLLDYCSIFYCKYPPWVNLVQKLFELKFGT